VKVVLEFEKMPLAPPAGAVNVTVTPLTGLPPAVTVATRGLAKAELIAAFCPDPLVAAMVVAGAAVLVSAKLAELEAPVVVAVTL
jgi:hypothetical protein